MVESYWALENGWHPFNGGQVIPFDTSNGFVPGWGNPTFEDHFDAPTLNTAVWFARNGYQDGQDGATMRPANVVIEDSCLKLRVKRENDNGRLYTSGYVDSIGKWSKRYGRFEFRARLPTLPNVSRGFWPGIWLRDNSGGGEVDIMESIGSPNNHPEVYPATPGAHSSSLYRQTGVSSSNYWSEIFHSLDVGDGNFHTFAVEWTPAGFTFFHDGIQTYKTTQSDYDTKFAAGFPSAVNIRLDVFVGSNWGGFPDEGHPEWTVCPADLAIDYFRYWEYQP